MRNSTSCRILFRHDVRKPKLRLSWTSSGCSGLLRWVQLDLGAARTINEVRLYAPSDGLQVHLGLVSTTPGNSSLLLAHSQLELVVVRYAQTTDACSAVT